MSYIEELTNRAEDILSKLVSFDTTSDKSNLKLLSYIEEILTKANVPYELVPNETGDKASLFATLGPDLPGGIGLSGHTDCVPVLGQAWDTDPFQLTLKGDKLFGRGSTDMKGFLSCMLAAIPLFQSGQLKRPVYLIFSYDEEIGCTGVRPLIEQLGRRLPMPELVIVGEPSNGQVVEAHKAISSFATKICGHEAHSSVNHLGVSAIEMGARLVAYLSDAQDKLKLSQHDPRFDPSYSTVHVGIMKGGTARNIVARECEFLWEVRALPGFDGTSVADDMMAYATKELLPAMKAISPLTSIETIERTSVPGLASDTETVGLGLKLANQNESFVVSYGTEAGLFQIGGAPSVICGPGNIEQAHKPNEYIERAELAKCMTLMERVATHQQA